MLYFALILFLLPLSIPAATPGSALENHTGLGETANPVIIPGVQLGHLCGKEISLVRVVSFRNGILAPIPFQIDQVDSRGDWVWDVAYQKRLVSDYEDDHHEGIGNLKWKVEQRTGLLDDEDHGKKGIIDANDLLVFMAKDMGERVPGVNRKLDGAGTILEIEIFHVLGNGKAWAYIAYYESNPPPYSSRRYVRYLPDSRKVVSSVYEVVFSKEHIAVLEQLEIGHVPLMDRTKLRGSMLLGRKSLGKTFYFNAENIHGDIDGYIDGPVRVVRRNSASLRFGLVFSSPEIYCDQ